MTLSNLVGISLEKIKVDYDTIKRLIAAAVGHLKRRFQMGRSRMKSDRTTESSGYCAMLGFNLSQLMRNLNGEVVKKVA